MYENYKNYSKGKKKNSKPVETEEKVEEVEPEVIEETVLETKTVSGCELLNLRPTASTNLPPIAILKAGDTVTLDPTEYPKGWNKVTTDDGITGFCMSEYLK